MHGHSKAILGEYPLHVIASDEDCSVDLIKLTA